MIPEGVEWSKLNLIRTRLLAFLVFCNLYSISPAATNRNLRRSRYEWRLKRSVSRLSVLTHDAMSLVVLPSKRGGFSRCLLYRPSEFASFPRRGWRERIKFNLLMSTWHERIKYNRVPGGTHFTGTSYDSPPWNHRVLLRAARSATFSSFFNFHFLLPSLFIIQREPCLEATPLTTHLWTSPASLVIGRSTISGLCESMKTTGHGNLVVCRWISARLQRKMVLSPTLQKMKFDDLIIFALWIFLVWVKHTVDGWYTCAGYFASLRTRVFVVAA